MRFRVIAIATAIAPYVGSAQAVGRPPLGAAEIESIARLEMLEDQRRFDSTAFAELLGARHAEVRRRAALAVGRVADKRGMSLLRRATGDRDTAVAATVVFAAGQLKDTSLVAWFDSVLVSPRVAPTVATEAAAALGKLKTASARAALARFLSSARATPQTSDVIGEALLSIGRSTTRGDLAPILRWSKSPDEEIRWRATWALFRPRDPAAVSALLASSSDPSGHVRSWAVRGLARPQADSAGLADGAERRLLAALSDTDRRVRTEAVRALGTYSDSGAVRALTDASKSPDSWISVSASEGLARIRAAAEPPAAPAPRRGGGRGASPSTRAAQAIEAASSRSIDDYRAIVKRWVVPAYEGKPNPVARWETTRGVIEVELYAGEAPLAVDYFVQTIDSGTVVGTEFTRVVPDFVDQQQGIRNGRVLRDEVNRHRLTRANLAWASAGLDTGSPGYTLNHTPQPHNEGDFTSMGRVIRGMDVVDRIQLGDRVTGARLISRN